jgi:hypothetical protein
MGADERARILSLLEAGTISADQAAVLLEAISSKASTTQQARPSAPPAVKVTQKPPAQVLRIAIDAQDEDDENVKVNVNVPLKLARFALNFMPQEARVELNDQGIDLSEILSSLSDDLPDGPLVDIDATENDGAKTVKIRIEVA